MITAYKSSGILVLILGSMLVYSCTPHNVPNVRNQAEKTRKINAWKVGDSFLGSYTRTQVDSSGCHLCNVSSVLKAVVDSLTDNDSVEIIRTGPHSYFADEIGFMRIRLNWEKNPYDNSDNVCVIKSVTICIGIEDEFYKIRDTLALTDYDKSAYFLKPCSQISISRLSNEIYRELLRFVCKTMDDYGIEW